LRPEAVSTPSARKTPQSLLMDCPAGPEKRPAATFGLAHHRHDPESDVVVSALRLEPQNGRDKIVYLDRLLVIGLASRSDLVLNSEPRHGSLATQALSQRLDRCPVGPPGTADAPTGPGGGPAKDRLPGSPRRGLLSAVDGLLLGRPASRLSPRGHGPLLLPSVAPGGVVGADPRHAPRHGPTAGGSSIAAQCRQHRQPDGQGHPHQRPEGLRRGEKKSTASSGTCWWTRSA